MVVYLPGQLFAAYEFGRLVRWGPVSSGRRSNPNGLWKLRPELAVNGKGKHRRSRLVHVLGTSISAIAKVSAFHAPTNYPDIPPATAAFGFSNQTPSGFLNGDTPGCWMPAVREC